MEPYRPTISFWSRSQYEEHRATLCGSGRPICTSSDHPGTGHRITVTVYSRFHNSCACCAMSRSTYGFGPVCGVPKGRPSRRSSIAFRPLERAADCGGSFDSGCRRRVGWHREKRRKIGDQRSQRRRRCEFVTLARELRPRARPCPAKERLTNPATTLD